MSDVVATIGLLVGPPIITITDPVFYRSIIDRSRGYRGLGISSFLLCIVIVVRVIEDDYLAVTRRPEDVAVKIAKKLSGELFIARSINNERGRVEHWDLPRGIALLEHQ
jgi:hypothetical protein